MNKLKNIIPNGELLTYKQVAEKCNIGEKTIMKLAKEAGATIKIGHISRVNWEKFYNYILTVYQE